jgi:hypothetical protein
VPLLVDLYSYIVETHKIDAVVIFDGGSDSLMKGDEEGLGDPIEDCVSLTAVSKLQVRMLESRRVGRRTEETEVSNGAYFPVGEAEDTDQCRFWGRQV